MSKYCRLLLCVLVAFLLFNLVSTCSALGQIKPGYKLPSLTGRNLAGETISIDSYLGTPIVVLAFWSIYCKPCVAEMSSLIKLQEIHKNEVVVIGINTDGELPPGRVRTFIERYEKFENKKINYQIIFDEHNKMTKQLKIGYLPTVIAVDKTGTVLSSFIGFEGKDEAEIFQGIENILPISGKAVQEDRPTVFMIESTLPACGFYDETGWRESFYGQEDLENELSRMSKTAKELALKMAMKKALQKLGILLCEKETATDCFQSYGVFLHENPWKQRDCLTNLLNSIPFRNYTQILESREQWLNTEYYIRQKIAVNLSQLKDDLERLDFLPIPLSINFAVINMDPVDMMMFQKQIMAQSKFLGKTDFPAYTVYTSQDNFIRELEQMVFEGPRVFISDAGRGVIEVELWR